MMWTSPCLRVGMPAAVKRTQFRVRWCAEAGGSGRRARGAGGAQKAGAGHLWHLGDCGAQRWVLAFLSDKRDGLKIDPPLSLFG